MRQAIVWPLVNDQSIFTPYLVSSEPSEFSQNLLKELQAHITEILENTDIEDGEARKGACEFIQYVPTSNSNTSDTVQDIIVYFETIIDALAEEVDDVDELSQWRVKLLTKPLSDDLVISIEN